MKRTYVQIDGKEYPYISNITLIGDWKEVEGLPLSAITKNDADTEHLDGLVLKGYEMKWGVTNENGERYETTAFDAFINEYFVEKGFNMIVDINHQGWRDWKAQVGRVIYAETNTVGFYVVAYIPRTEPEYGNILQKLKEGILQGFSKEGYATDWEFKWKDDRTFDYELVKEMKILSVSLVSAPANALPFEAVKEVRNGLKYVNKTITADKGSTLSAMFNKK